MKSLLEEPESVEELVHEAEQLIDRRNTDALPLAKRVMALAMKSGNAKHFAQAKYILAFYQCLVANNYDAAIELCNEGLQGIKPEEIYDVSYKFYMTLGNAYQLKGEIFAAQESYMMGLKQLEARTNHTPTEKGFLASFYYNVSLLLNTSELNICTQEYLEKAIEIFEATGSQFKLSKSYVVYAGILEKKNEYDKAIMFLSKALLIDTQTNDVYSIALSTANIGILHLRVNKYTEALGYLNQSLTFYQDSSMAFETGMVKAALGEALFATSSKQEGINRLMEAEEIFKKLDNKRELSHVHRLLAQFIEETGDTGTALHYQKLYTESLKDFFDIEKTNSLNRAKKEFESEQKEKEGMLLREKNEEIKRYVKRLEISNNELKQFAHVASHDLREPLRMVTSYVGLIERSLGANITTQQSEFIGFAVDGAKRMELLIIDLLRLAKVDTNTKIEKVKLQNLAEEIQLNLDVLLKEKGGRIIFEDLPEIYADRTQMLQLLQNIVGNGIKYNENKSPFVKIKSVLWQKELELTITDNGIGIPAAYRERIFEIFQRLETTKKYSGTGIGLTICKKIVSSMNGKISVEDNPAGGTIFKIRFPVDILC